METWANILEFPGYSVSDYGWVRNDDTGRTMAMQKNQSNVVHVGLMRNAIQYKRSVPLLVARSFVDMPNEDFDTPIQLDGDPYNTHCLNIHWRPWWFAVKYKRQLTDRQGHDRPLVELGTGETFDNSWHAATKYGLLVDEIRLAMMRNTYVFPTFQRFAFVPQNRY